MTRVLILAALVFIVNARAAEPLVGTWLLERQELNGTATSFEPLTLRISQSGDNFSFAFSVPVNKVHFVSMSYTVRMDGTEADVKNGQGEKIGSIKMTKAGGSQYNLTLSGLNAPDLGQAHCFRRRQAPYVRIRAFGPSVLASVNFLRRLLHRPRQLWIRQFNFQIHLWVGIILGLYMLMMGVTGSILVFSVELENLAGTKPWHSIKPSGPFADIGTVMRNLRMAYPHFQIVSVMAPVEANPTFEGNLQGRRRIKVALDPKTGQILGEFPRGAPWLSAIQQLHVSLFVSRSGRILNGVGAAFLLLLCTTGLVNWWPGVRNWKRALAVNFHRNWRRINYDLHSATGFWTLAIISLWAVSGIYFAWPGMVFGLVNRISPIVTAKPPAVTVRPLISDTEPVGLGRLIRQASAMDPGTIFRGVIFPYSRTAPLEILMMRGQGLGREYEDTLYFDPYTGAHLATWRYGVNQSLGDWFIWSQVPLHFGVYWGLGFKIVWAILGLAAPLLAVTGLLMYWNRELRKKWRRLTAAPQIPPA